MTYISHYTSPLGTMTMASDGENLIGLWFDGQKYDRANLRNEQLQEIVVGTVPESVEGVEPIEQTRQWLDTYFSGKIPTFTPPLKLTGSDFRQQVSKILLTIPYGHTMTYGEIAKIIVQERSPLPQQGGLGRVPQAVGGAVGHNPISLIIPCHRVISTPSSTKQTLLPPKQCGRGGLGLLTGYAGGVERKLWLLNHEQKTL